MKRPVGRPTLLPEQRQTFKRVALYPSTQEKVRLISKKNNIKIVDLLDDLVNRNYNDDGERRKRASK